MMVLWPIALITFKEGLRNRTLYGISLIAFLLLGVNIIFSGLFMRDLGKVAVDTALSTMSFAGLLMILFVGINLMAKDLDKRTIYMVLSRPISRPQYIIGKFLGMLLLIATTVAFLSVFCLLSIVFVKLAYPDFFPHFSWGLVLLAILFIMLSLIVLSALSYLFASFASTSFITLTLTIIAYIIGHSLDGVKAIIDAPQTMGLAISPGTVKAVHAAYYLFPNLSLFDLKMQAAHGLAVPINHIVWTFLYGAVYSCLAIGAAALIFRKKEFP